MESWLVQSIFLGALAGLIPSPHTYFCHEAARLNDKKILFLAIIIGVMIDLGIISLVKFLKPSSYSLVFILLFGMIYFFILARKLYFTSSSTRKCNFSIYDCLKSHLFNPNPYLFWLSIGSLYLNGDSQFYFILSFLTTMVLMKLLHINILLILEKKILTNRFLIIRNKTLSIAFVALSSKFMIEGIRVIKHVL